MIDTAAYADAPPLSGPGLWVKAITLYQTRSKLSPGDPDGGRLLEADRDGWVLHALLAEGWSIREITPVTGGQAFAVLVKPIPEGTPKPGATVPASASPSTPGPAPSFTAPPSFAAAPTPPQPVAPTSAPNGPKSSDGGEAGSSGKFRKPLGLKEQPPSGGGGRMRS
jgi:hypothetical protein